MNSNYYFKVSQTAFVEALNMFSSLFIDPHFVQDPIERESSAVNGEYEMDLSKDAWKV